MTTTSNTKLIKLNTVEEATEFAKFIEEMLVNAGFKVNSSAPIGEKLSEIISIFTAFNASEAPVSCELELSNELLELVENF